MKKYFQFYWSALKGNEGPEACAMVGLITLGILAGTTLIVLTVLIYNGHILQHR